MTRQDDDEAGRPHQSINAQNKLLRKISQNADSQVIKRASLSQYTVKIG